MRLGDRIVKKSNLAVGSILAARKQVSGVYMVCIEWESDGSYQWLPSTEVRPQDKLPTPPSKPLPVRRKKGPWSQSERRKAEYTKVANYLMSLSDEKKTRSDRKAKKITENFHKRNGGLR